ncbi:Omega-hydroxypalmitate O-feruloyl transferase [Triticum urartu]|uniref:Omega-hydroxypalmitate O-feruloyl transferase n=1 Tax=Triticum urartu TaxID=4572 RepID=M8A3Q9_TRIUA|nr:Omega-hydroxypalmitate O-feruloyl transferase [Triticum urartu]
MAAAPTVAKSPPALVPPAGPTPGGTLPLSAIDKTAAVRVMVDFIQVFHSPPSGDDQVATMRQGFARALVPYYPVAGRIAEPSPGEPVVDCTGEGVWFVEAAASCSLADVNGLEDRPLAIPKADLIPRPPADHKLDDQILLAQPTYVFTLNDDVNIVPSVVYLKPPKPKQGIRLVLQCVEEPHAAVFTDELEKLA